MAQPAEPAAVAELERVAVGVELVGELAAVAHHHPIDRGDRQRAAGAIVVVEVEPPALGGRPRAGDATVREDALVEQEPSRHGGIVRLARPGRNGEATVHMWRLLVVAAACGGSQVAAPHAPSVGNLLPATLEAARPKQGDPRTLHVRVLVDAGVRAVPHWKEDITEQIDYAGQLLVPLVGVRLAVDKIAEWNRTGDPATALAELERADDGKGVAWVIGYVTPPDAASKAMSELADARVLGHHVVVRGWSEKAETDALAGRLPDLRDAQRAEVIAAHRRHKQTVALLHGLAITAGAIGEADPTWIQHPTYSPKQSAFSERDRELIQIAVDGLLAENQPPAIAHDVLEAIEKAEWGGWIASSHDEVVTALRNIVDRAKAGKTAADVPAAAYQQFTRVDQLAKRGEVKEALIELDNLLTAYPGNPAMHELKCEILLAVCHDAKPLPRCATPGVTDKATRAACTHASELAPGDPAPHLAVGEALARAGDATGARAELEQAARTIPNLKEGVAGAWQRVIAVYLAMGALTWTEDALAAAKLDNDPARAIIAQTRVRYGVPRGAKFVAPEQEAALVTATRGALDLVYAQKFGDADRALTSAEKRWPSAPGLAAARCDLDLRQNQLDTARAACKRALDHDADDSWALYLSGVIALRDTGAGGTAAGIARLKRAITVDPDLAQAWRALAKAYARANDKAALDDLARQYQAKFGTPLAQ